MSDPRCPFPARPEGPFPLRGPTPSWEAALGELRRHQRRELARRLGEAALLRARGEGLGELLAPVVDPPPPVRRWRRATRRDLEAARGTLDGHAVRAARHELERCARAPLSRWPAARDLAHLGLATFDSGWGRLCRSEVDLAAGRADEALEELSREVARASSASLRSRAYGGVAFAHELRGCDRLALGAAEGAVLEAEAARDGRCADPVDVDLLVRALFLALAAGDGRRARWAAGRLDADVSVDADALGASVGRLRRRVRRLRAAPWRPPAATARLFGHLCASRSTPARAVCRALR